MDVSNSCRCLFKCLYNFWAQHASISWETREQGGLSVNYQELENKTSLVDIPISGHYITLGALMKWAGAATTGGEAKQLIQDGHVLVNGTTETRRRRKIMPGDRISIAFGPNFRISGGGSCL